MKLKTKLTKMEKSQTDQPNVIAFCSHDKGKYKNTFLGGDEAIFSNWYPSKFIFSQEDFMKYLGVKAKSQEFVSVEQAMMFGKAMLFNDIDVAVEILKSDNQKEIRELGRKVQNYNEVTWNDRRYNYVKGLILEKFKQNPDLLDILKKTGTITLVEGAWYDKIWGVGLRDTDSLIQDPTNWKGQNLLGKALMEVRELLQ